MREKKNVLQRLEAIRRGIYLQSTNELAMALRNVQHEIDKLQQLADYREELNASHVDRCRQPVSTQSLAVHHKYMNSLGKVMSHSRDRIQSLKTLEQKSKQEMLDRRKQHRSIEMLVSKQQRRIDRSRRVSERNRLRDIIATEGERES